MRALTVVLATAAVFPVGPAAGAMVAEDVLAFGAPEHGSTGSLTTMSAPVVGIAAHPAGGGYWEVASDGGVFSFGRAGFAGSSAGQRPASPVVGMAADPDGRGYWLAAADGSVSPFDAPDLGSGVGNHLNAPVVGVTAFPGGGGYWLVAADGGVFSFGKAPFLGSAGSTRLNAPVVALASTVDGLGYWLVAADGGVFSFGQAPFLGSAGSLALNAPVVGMAADPDGQGYWLASADGGVFSYDALFRGSGGGAGLDGKLAAGIVADRASGGYWMVLRRLASARPPKLQAGDVGPGVLALERQLVALGYWLGSPDEAFDATTSHAVVAAQKVAGLPRDGVVVESTWRALDRGSRPAPASREGQVIEVDRDRQVLTAVNNGKVAWIFDTSTGRPGLDTPAGRFTVDQEFDTADWHGQYRPKRFYGPRDLTIHGYSSVPPDPFSHGCARVVDAAMDFIWAEGLAPVGTPVWVS